jgi:hypothetical protein
MIPPRMSAQVLYKLIGLVSVFLLILFTPDQWILVTSWALAHYLISFIYSVKSIRPCKENFIKFCALIALIIIAIYLGQKYSHLILWFFGIHHVLSETYAFDNEIEIKENSKNHKLLNVSCFFLNLFLFLNIVSFDLLFQNAISKYILLNLLAISALAYLICFFKMHKLNSVTRSNMLIFHALGFIFLIYNHLHIGPPILLIHIILYHIFYWTIWPMTKMTKTSSIALYVAITLICSIGFLMWMKPDFYHSSKTWGHYVGIFKFWGFFHIITSIGLSNDNPKLISNFFNWRK